VPRKRSRGNDAIEKTPLGNRIVRIARKHGVKTHFSKNWYLKLYRDDKVTYLPLFEGKVRSADLADDIKNFLRREGKTINDAKREFFDGVRAPSTAIYSTIGEVLNFHSANVVRLEVRKDTAKAYREALLLVIRHALAFQKGKRLVYERGKKLDLTEFYELSTAILTDKLVRDFKEAFVGDKKDGAATTRAQRSANSYLGNAQAVFSKKALQLYRDNSLKLPDLHGFTDELGFKNKKRKYIPPGDVEISQLILASGNMDREAEKVFILALFFGLRREEILECRYGWMRTSGTIIVEQVDNFIPKSGQGRTIENMGAWEKLGRLFEDPPLGADHIIKGNETDRIAAVKRCIAYVRNKGLKENKPLHELRKLYGCFRATVTGDLFQVQKELGHATVDVTHDYYATTRISNPELVDVWLSRYPRSDEQIPP
jgi:integrase